MGFSGARDHLPRSCAAGPRFYPEQAQGETLNLALRDPSEAPMKAKCFEYERHLVMPCDGFWRVYNSTLHYLRQFKTAEGARKYIDERDMVEEEFEDIVGRHRTR